MVTERFIIMNLKNWNNLSPKNKAATVALIISMAITVVSFFVQPSFLSFDMTYLGIAMMSLCEAILDWESNRKFSYLYIGATIIMLICCILELKLF